MGEGGGRGCRRAEAAVDAGAGEPGVGAGEGRRGAAPGGVPGAGRVADGAGVAHPLPRHRPGGVLPARRLRLRAPRPRPRHRRRRLPLGRRHPPRRRLRLLPPDGDLAGAQRRRARAGAPGDQLPRCRLQRRPHTRRGVQVAADDLQPRLGVLLAPVIFLGVAGWRLAFHLVAIVSFVVGVLMWFLAADPRAKSKTTIAAASAADKARQLLRDARGVIGVATFQIIVAQGIAGSIPWSALNFSAMWLELVGFTHWETSVITGLYLFATALDALFGGLVGDPVSRRFPNTGRIALAQISSASAIPLVAVLLLALPNDPSTGVAHAVVFFVMGFAISWNASSTNTQSLQRLYRRRLEQRFTLSTNALRQCSLRLRLRSSVF